MIRSKPKTTGATKYHHGDLPKALLCAAETVMNRDGIGGLTLRATAREAGVSHAAPKNHFDNLTGLLSELAAVGFERLRHAMLTSAESAKPERRLSQIGKSYVVFARDNPALFQLMFRSDQLDYERPSLRHASTAAFEVLSGSIGKPSRETSTMSSEQVAEIARAWALVHGLSVLQIDGRLQRLMDRAPKGTDLTTLLTAILGSDT